MDAALGDVDLDRHAVVVISDHGNLEESHHDRHTLNPAPLLAWGRGAADLASKVVKKTSEPISANIILCRKISKKKGKPIGAGTTFTIKDKAKVKAIVNVTKPDIKTNEQMKFYFDWIGPDGKSFYKKRIVYTTSNPSFTISNSIAITPDKRLPGNYILKVTHRKKIIAEKNFTLVLPEQQ